jgi:hypothetical protein
MEQLRPMMITDGGEMSVKNSTPGITLESSLQTFFFDELNKINASSTTPIPMELVFYGSTVMDHFGDSSRYFDIVEGRVRDKILGTKFLEASHYDRRMQKKAFREIGDTSLFLCGYFSDSVKDRVVDLSYYQNLGKSAYGRLNALVPEAYAMNGFYKKLANAFDGLSNIMSIVAHNMQDKDNSDQFVLYIGQSRRFKAS